MRGVVAIDIGRSAVKCMGCGVFKKPDGGIEHKRVSFLSPAVAFPAISIGDEVGAERSRAETVYLHGTPWFFGKTAEAQSLGNHSTGLSASWIESDEHSVLFLGAIKRLEDLGMIDVTESLFVLGLPTDQHSAKKGQLKQILGGLYPGIEILVSPQPSGALHRDILTEKGMENIGRSLSTESVAVVEVGCFTTDFILYQNGEWIEQGAYTTVGVKVAAERLIKLLAENHDAEVGFSESQEILISKKLIKFGDLIDVSDEVEIAKAVLSSKIADEADRLFPRAVARKLSKIIVAGGGAPLVVDRLKAKWPHVVMLPDHRIAIADGFCRLGSRILMARAIAGQR